MFVEHPLGGHCNLDGMTDECYGCICYGGGLIDDCKKNVEILREYYQKNSKGKHDKRRVDKKDRNT